MKNLLKRSFNWKLVLILCVALGLRLYHLTKVPVALHGDELGAGYNAYSLLLTGRDEYAHPWPLSFRENISPLNFYLMIPFVAVWGPTELAVRLPGVAWGMMTILVTYLLVKELFNQPKWKFSVAEISALFLAISPWHIELSRIAHDAGLGLLLQVGGSWLFIKGLRQPKWWYLSMLSFGLSFYAYHAPKVTTPLLLVSLLILWRQAWKKSQATMVRAIVVAVLVSLPGLLLIFATPLSQNRLAGISILIREVTLYPTQALSFNLPGWQKLLWYNPLTIYGVTFLRQYFAYLDWGYLFFDATLVRYFNVSRVGLNYLWDVPFILIGIYTLLKEKTLKYKLPIFWVLIAPVAGAITLGPPNAGRASLFLPMLQVIAAIGFCKCFASDRWQTLMWVTVWVGAINVSLFMHQYFYRSPIEFGNQWGYGIREVVLVAKRYESEVNKILFTDSVKQPYIYVLFYGHPDPKWLQDSQKVRHASIGYQKMGKYEFGEINWDNDREVKGTLLVGTAAEIPDQVDGLVAEIYGLDNKVLFRVVKT